MATKYATPADATAASTEALRRRAAFLDGLPGLYAEGLLPREMVARDKELALVQAELAERGEPIDASPLAEYGL